MRGAQDHARRVACLKGFLPARSTEAPTVTWVQAWKAECGNWCRKIVAARFGEFEKRRRHNSADRVTSRQRSVNRRSADPHLLGSSPGRPISSPRPAPRCVRAASGLALGSAARLPSRSARESQAAMQNASCWSRVAASRREAAAPKRRIDLGDGRAPGRNVPTVERPEMGTRSEPLADEAQPGNAGMGGFRHRSLHVEMKDRFRAAGALLGQAAASERCPCAPRRCRARRRGRNRRRCPRRSANGAGNRRGKRASRASGHAPRNSAAGTRSRGRCRPASGCPRRAARPAIRRCPCASSICGAMAAAELRPEAALPSAI